MLVFVVVSMIFAILTYLQGPGVAKIIDNTSTTGASTLFITKEMFAYDDWNEELQMSQSEYDALSEEEQAKVRLAIERKKDPGPQEEGVEEEREEEEMDEERKEDMEKEMEEEEAEEEEREKEEAEEVKKDSLIKK